MLKFTLKTLHTFKDDVATQWQITVKDKAIGTFNRKHFDSKQWQMATKRNRCPMGARPSWP